MFDVITIGSSTQDVFLEISESKTIKTPRLLHRLGFSSVNSAQCLPLGAKIEADHLAMASGGGATNSAVTFARQGLKTATCFKTGADDFGRTIVTDLKKESVTTKHSISKSHPTGYSTILITKNGSRTIIVHRGAENYLTTADLPKSFVTRWVYINPANISFPVINNLVRRLSREGISIAINPSSAYLKLGLDKLEPILRNSQVVIMNREEASLLTGQPLKNERAIFKKLDEIVPGIAVMTEGPKGLMVSDGSYLWQTGIFPNKDIVDRTGAGDAFGAGFVAGLIQSDQVCFQNKCRPDDIKFAIRLGSANATSVVEDFGAKAGLLTKKQFTSSSRWRRLKITRTKL